MDMTVHNVRLPSDSQHPTLSEYPLSRGGVLGKSPSFENLVEVGNMWKCNVVG